MKKPTFVGWILCEESEGYKDLVFVEYTNRGTNERIKTPMNARGESGAAEAVEWWCNRTEKHVKVEPTFRGCYRVYTEEDE